jgi:copper(I)-binding protein
MKKMLVLLAVVGAFGAQAQTTVKDPWVRGTVSGQKATGMFGQIVSASGGKLVSASSPVAGVVEVHEMVIDGNVMKMRAVTGLELPAGKAVELKPGGYHVMLMDLKQELKAGESVPVTLIIEGAGGKRESVDVKAPVKALADGGHKKH